VPKIEIALEALLAGWQSGSLQQSLLSKLLPLNEISIEDEDFWNPSLSYTIANAHYFDIFLLSLCLLA
jgi:hypothetical protein